MWPKVVSSYEITSLLGHGNYGQVRLAEHITTRKQYAVKILPREFLDMKQYTIDIRREISILMALDHPNIIHLHEVVVESSRLYLVMELATNGDLFNLLNDHGPLSEHKSRAFFTQLIDAVTHCHSRGIYHRDLKPENILLTSDSQTMKLADFGFAAVVDKYSSVHRLLRTNCGSPHYCAPEVWNGEHANGYDGSKADAFSCGVILYCMLVGAQPFYDSCEELVLTKVNKCQLQFPTEMSPLARDLIEKLLVREPDKRLCLKWARQHPWMLSDRGPLEDKARLERICCDHKVMQGGGKQTCPSLTHSSDLSLVSDSSQEDSQGSITP